MSALPRKRRYRRVRNWSSPIQEAAVALRKAGFRVWRRGRWRHYVGGNGLRPRIVTDQGLLKFATEMARPA